MEVDKVSFVVGDNMTHCYITLSVVLAWTRTRWTFKSCLFDMEIYNIVLKRQSIINSVCVIFKYCVSLEDFFALSKAVFATIPSAIPECEYFLCLYPKNVLVVVTCMRCSTLLIISHEAGIHY